MFGTAADPAGVLPAVAEVDRDGIVRVARHDPNRGLDCPVADPKLDHRDLKSAVFAALGIGLLRYAQPRGGLRANERALSQVSVVIGLGHSWSQPLLANRPS